jgi:N-acetylglucosaminyl-diphospho-decaprenol L-rhamnosyltransferase
LLRGALRSRSSRTQLSIPPDDTQSLQRVDAVSGALMLLPRALHTQLGGFDERYRLHAEDLDLCRRARLAGASVAVANDVRVVHVRGVSSRSRPWFVEWHKHRGLWRYFATFEAARRPAAVRAAVFALVWARFPVAALRAWARSHD